MAEAGRALARAETSEGHRQGTHAQTLLLAAVQSLESTFRQTAAALVQQLAEEARRQAAAQQQEAGQCTGLAQHPDAATAAAAAARRAAAAAAQKDAAALLRNTAEFAQALDDNAPEASAALTAAAQQTRDDGLDAAMTRAVNALLYQKFDNPMLGILAGHLALMSHVAGDEGVREGPGLLRIVVQNLRDLLQPPHPDVEALALAAAMPTLPFSNAPMLRRSWELVTRAAANRPEILPPSSPARKFTDSICSEEPLLIRCVSAVNPEFQGGWDLSADLPEAEPETARTSAFAAIREWRAGKRFPGSG